MDLSVYLRIGSYLVRFAGTAIVIFCFLLGLIIEVIQEKFVAGRHFEWGDVLFNSLGTLLILGLNKKMAPSKL